jgi:predicted kinase
VVVAIAGPPCAGKSTIAAAVSGRLGIPHLSMDGTRQRLLPGAAHTRADREVAYRAMQMAAELLHGAGAALVLDAPYGHAEDRDALAPLDPVWVACRVSPEVAVQRLAQRGFDPERPDLTPEIVREAAANYRYASGALVLDTESLTPAECVAAVLKLVSSRPAEAPSTARLRDRSGRS